MRCLASFALFVGLLLLLGLETWAQESGPTDVSLSLGVDRVTKRVKSFKDLREEGVVLQKLDYSCGAAALATLFSGFFQEKVTEDIVIGFIFIHGQTPEEGLKKYFRRKGFSLLDLKRFAEFRGYKAAGYKEMTLEDLVGILNEDRVPVLVSINPLGFNHFVVVRGIRGDRIFLADPAVGNTTMSLSRFQDTWVDGIGFVVTSRPLAMAPRTAPSDDELAWITAAGAPGASSRANPSSLVASEPPSPLGIRPTEPVPDVQRIRSVIERQASPEVPRFVQSYTDDRGVYILSIFTLQNYSPGIQLGRPAGDFIDFSPPRGQVIRSQPQ